jgi:hypothetical protein
MHGTLDSSYRGATRLNAVPFSPVPLPRFLSLPSCHIYPLARPFPTLALFTPA